MSSHVKPVSSARSPQHRRRCGIQQLHFRGAPDGGRQFLDQNGMDGMMDSPLGDVNRAGQRKVCPSIITNRLVPPNYPWHEIQSNGIFSAWNPEGISQEMGLPMVTLPTRTRKTWKRTAATKSFWMFLGVWGMVSWLTMLTTMTSYRIYRYVCTMYIYVTYIIHEIICDVWHVMTW